MKMLPPIFSVRLQKYILNMCFILSIAFLEYRLYTVIEDYRPQPLFVEAVADSTHHDQLGWHYRQSQPKENDADPQSTFKVLHPDAYMALAVILLLGWLGVMLAYYAWAIYHYNINQGLTNEEWKKINDKKAQQAIDLKRELITEKDIEPDPVNPYKDETFGLPPGTVRGTIALSLLVAMFALIFLSKDPVFQQNPAYVKEYFEFVRNAIIMMIAFYFGNQSLKILRETEKPSAFPPPKPGPVPVGAIPAAAATPTPGPGPAPDPVVTEPSPRIAAVEPSVPVSLASLSRPAVVEREESHPSPSLTLTEIDEVAEKNGLDSAHIKAVLQVESRGKGFLEDGRPVILFEGHKFYALLKAIKPTDEFNALVAANPEILYEKWTKTFYKGGAKEYSRYDAAFAIHPDSAMQATSWGLFQVMGFNYKTAGFDTVQEFVEAQRESERRQLETFIQFLKSTHLLKPLQDEDWRTFAKGYNGRRYEENQYHTRLAEAYMHFLQKDKPTLTAVLTRTSTLDKETLGDLVLSNGIREIFRCRTLELPWRDNQRQISCIPPGKYKVTRHTSPRHGDVFLVHDVPNRSNILVHAGNYFADTLGCILVGKEVIDINKDKVPDITSSKVTLAALRQMAPNGFTLTVQNKYAAPAAPGLIT